MCNRSVRLIGDIDDRVVQKYLGFVSVFNIDNAKLK